MNRAAGEDVIVLLLVGNLQGIYIVSLVFADLLTPDEGVMCSGLIFLGDIHPESELELCYPRAVVMLFTEDLPESGKVDSS